MRREHRLLVGVAVAWISAFAVAIVVSGEPKEVLDGYDKLAGQLLSRGRFAYADDGAPTMTRGPMYPLVLAGELLVAQGSLEIVRWLEGAMLVVAAAIVTRTAREWVPWPAAVLSGLAVAFHPLLLYYTAKLGSETFSALLFAIAGHVALTRKLKTDFARSTIYGALVGVAILTKSVFVALIPAYIIVEVFRGRGSVRVVRSAVIVAISASILVLPWIGRNRALSGFTVGTQTLGWWNFWYDHQFDRAWEEGSLRAGGAGEAIFSQFPWYQGHPYHLTPAADAEQEQRLRQEALLWIQTHPRAFSVKVGTNVLQFWSQAASKPLSRLAGLLWIAQGILCVAGTRVLLRFRVPLPAVWSWALAALMCLLMAPVFALVRHSIVLVPAAALLVGPAVAELLRRRSAPSPRKPGGDNVDGA